MMLGGDYWLRSIGRGGRQAHGGEGVRTIGAAEV
jgi:hypothetical protein